MAADSALPTDELSHGEWIYLSARYPDEAQFHEHHERIRGVLKRLIRKGHDAERLHRAWMAGIKEWGKHQTRQEDQHSAARRNRAVAKVRRQCDDALAGLRSLLPKDVRRVFSDDWLWEQRALLLQGSTVTLPPARTPGRPWEWKQITDSRLRDAEVTAADRREFLAAVGFLPDDE